MLRRFIQVVTLFGVVAGTVALGQPALALSTTPDPTWGVQGKVFALARSGKVMFVGGAFNKALDPGGNKVPANNLIAVDITTGSYMPTFTPSVLNTVATGKPEVDALAVSADGSTLFLGGKFDTVNGQPRQNFAAVDTATGTVVDPSFVASPNGKVQALLADADLVYLGGSFKRVDGIDRLHLAAVSAIDGSLSTSWAPSATAGTDPCPSQFPSGTNCGPTSNGGTGNVHSMAFAPDGDSVYVGGNFYYVNGVPRNTIAQVSATTGSLLDWRVPWASIPSESTSNPYRGPNVAWGRTPNGFSAFTPTATTTSSGECSSLPMGSGCATRLWNQSTPGNAESLALSPDGTRLFVGGHFGTAVLDYRISACGSNVWAHGLVSVNPATGAFFCDWFPQARPFGGQSAPGSGIDPPNYVGSWAMQMTDDALFVGGYFTSFSGVAQSGIARFTLVGSPPPLVVPTIASFTPTAGPIGTTVTINGTGFTGATGVAFGSGQATDFTVDSDTQITATVPLGANTAKVKVTGPGGTGTSATNFKVTTLTFSGMTPTTGPEGTQVVLSGAGFTGATDVSFGGMSATFSVTSDYKITTTVPAGATTGFITVTTPNGTAQSPSEFVVVLPQPAPTITSFSPTSGPVGTTVVITGTSFTGATAVKWGSVGATTFTIDSDTQITAEVPVGAPTAKIKVKTPAGIGASATSFKVTT
jgi:hypothetical protein